MNNRDLAYGGLASPDRAASCPRTLQKCAKLWAKRYLPRNRDERLETVLAEPHVESASTARDQGGKIDDPNAQMFIEGALRRIDGRTRESRRFAFVNSLDALVAVGGGHGARQQLTLAATIDKPVLPVPFFDGAAKKFWCEHRDICMSRLNIDEAMAAAWEKEPASPPAIKSRAKEVVSALLKTLPKRVFVIMPTRLNTTRCTTS